MHRQFVRTDAIVLRIIPYSATSEIVTWMTATHGKIATIVKGAKRPKSAFLGQYDQFYTCELLFYTGSRTGVRNVRECCPITTRSTLRHDWRATACASYICDLVARSIPDDAPLPELFRLVDETLNGLATGTQASLACAWFELRLLALLGLGPILSVCVDCGVDDAEKQSDAVIAYDRGGLLCLDCANGSHPDREIVAPDVLAIARHLVRSDHLSVTRLRPTRPQTSHLMRIAGRFIAHHLEIYPASRAIAVSLFSAPGAERADDQAAKKQG